MKTALNKFVLIEPITASVTQDNNSFSMTGAEKEKSPYQEGRIALCPEGSLLEEGSRILYNNSAAYGQRINNKNYIVVQEGHIAFILDEDDVI